MILKDIIYKGCEDLPMSAFLDVLVDNNYRALVRSKGVIKCKDSKLKALWEEIYTEYLELSGGEESKAYYNLVKKATVLEAKLYVVQAVVNSLSFRCNEELAKSLRFVGINVKISKETLQKDLLKVIARAKPIKIELEKVKEELAPYMRSDVGISKEAFYQALTVLGKFQGYRLDPYTTTVSEYTLILKNYKQWLQTQK